MCTILPCLHPLTHLPFILHLSLHLSICPCTHYLLTIIPFAHPSVHPSSHPSTHLSIPLPVCPLFVIHPLICPPSVTPAPVELWPLVRQPISTRLTNNRLSIPPVLTFQCVHLFLPSHPAPLAPPSHYSLSPIHHSFAHYPAFAHLSIYFSADLCTHPSTQLSLHPTMLPLLIQHHSHLSAYFFLHLPYTSLLTY